MQLSRAELVVAAMLAAAVTSVRAAGSIHLSAFPAPGTATDIAGSVVDLPLGAGRYKVVMYLQADTGFFWIKGAPQASYPVSSAGGFTIRNWASYIKQYPKDPAHPNCPCEVGDAAFKGISLLVIPAAAPVVDLLGAPIPDAVLGMALATGYYTRGYTASGTPAGGAAPSSSDGKPRVDFTPPPYDAGDAISGRVSGVQGGPSDYKLGILLDGRDSKGQFVWFDKTHDYPDGKPQNAPTGIPLQSDWTFLITGWVSDYHDYKAAIVRVVLLRSTFSFAWPAYQVEGVAWPYQYFSRDTVVALATANRQTGQMEYWSPDANAGDVPALPAFANGPLPPVPAGQVTMRLSQIPQGGTINPIAGSIAGLPTGQQGWWLIVLVQEPVRQVWWIKAQADSRYVVDASGAFIVTGWGSNPANDKNWAALMLMVVPEWTAVPAVLGTGIPASLTASAVLKVTLKPGMSAPLVVQNDAPSVPDMSGSMHAVPVAAAMAAVGAATLWASTIARG